MSQKEQKRKENKQQIITVQINEGSVDEGKKQSTTLLKNILESQIDSQIKINN